MKILISKVEGNEGLCTPVWINPSLVCRVVDGVTTGFFKNIKKYKFGWFTYNKKVGEEFHGYIDRYGIVRTTKGIYR